MNHETLLAILKDPQFKFDVQLCRNVNIPLQAAKFLRWVYLNMPCTDRQVNDTFGMGLALTMLKSGYVTHPLGQYKNQETNLWMLTSDGIEPLKRLVEGRKP